MSCPTVARVGIDVPGCPAFIKWLNSQSFTRFIGWLLSAHHLAIWALNEGKELVLVKRKMQKANLVSSIVWLIDTEAWPSRAKHAKIEPSQAPDVVLLKVALTASSLKHLTTCVIVLIFWFIWVASIHEQLLPFPCWLCLSAYQRYRPLYFDIRHTSVM